MRKLLFSLALFMLAASPAFAQAQSDGKSWVLSAWDKSNQYDSGCTVRKAAIDETMHLIYCDIYEFPLFVTKYVRQCPGRDVKVIDANNAVEPYNASLYRLYTVRFITDETIVTSERILSYLRLSLPILFGPFSPPPPPPPPPPAPTVPPPGITAVFPPPPPPIPCESQSDQKG